MENKKTTEKNSVRLFHLINRRKQKNPKKIQFRKGYRYILVPLY